MTMDVGVHRPLKYTAAGSQHALQAPRESWPHYCTSFTPLWHPTCGCPGNTTQSFAAICQASANTGPAAPAGPLGSCPTCPGATQVPPMLDRLGRPDVFQLFCGLEQATMHSLSRQGLRLIPCPNPTRRTGVEEVNAADA